MNAHALAALTTREPDDESTQAWIEHTAAVTLAWSALSSVIREEVDR